MRRPSVTPSPSRPWFLMDMHARGRTGAHPTLSPLARLRLCASPVLCPEHPSHSSLYLNPTGPAKSHISPLSKSQRRAGSSLESLQYFHPAKFPPLSSSDLPKKAPRILSSFVNVAVCNFETTAGFCYLYMQTSNSLKSATVS